MTNNNMRKLRFALFGNLYQAKKSVSVQKLLALLEEHEAEILMDRPFYDYLRHDMQIDVRVTELIDGDDFDADFVVSMGGDGTFLETARRVGGKGIPMLGVNMGRLGFLAEYQPEEMAGVLRSIVDDRYTSEERMVLEVAIEGEPERGYALNEVAVLKHDNSSMISIRVDINGEYLTTYQADGLIVNTPTGSTGYALSVGGAIMTPSCSTLGLVPVAPHSLTVRPLTLSAEAVITMRVESRSHNFMLAVDGRSLSMQEGVEIRVRRAPYAIRVVKRSGGSFYRTLRNKLMWGTDVRE